MQKWPYQFQSTSQPCICNNHKTTEEIILSSLNLSNLQSVLHSRIKCYIMNKISLIFRMLRIILDTKLLDSKTSSL